MKSNLKVVKQFSIEIDNEKGLTHTYVKKYVKNK